MTIRCDAKYSNLREPLVYPDGHREWYPVCTKSKEHNSAHEVWIEGRLILQWHDVDSLRRQTLRKVETMVDFLENTGRE